MISITGRIYYRDGENSCWGQHWKYGIASDYEDIVVSCDHEGCNTTASPDGLEHNGPVIECIYGMDGWFMEEKDLCPEHVPDTWTCSCDDEDGNKHWVTTDKCWECRATRPEEDP
jgi:hypothetical protein